MDIFEFNKSIKATLNFSVVHEGGALRGVYGIEGTPEAVKITAANFGPERHYIRFLDSNNVGEYTCDWNNVPAETKEKVLTQLRKHNFTYRHI